MKVKNNQKNPYMLCGKLIPPGMVMEVADDEYLKMLEIKAFQQLVTKGLLEEVDKPLPPSVSPVDIPPVLPVAPPQGKK